MTGTQPSSQRGAPTLPEDAPPDLRDFVGCTADSVRLDLDDADWLPAPGGFDVAAPEVDVQEGPRPGSVTVTATWGGFFSVTLPVSVVDGRLDVDVRELPLGLGDGVHDWVADLNDHLEGNGKELGRIRLDGTTVALEKLPLTVPASDEAVREGTEAGPADGGPARASILDYLDEDALDQTMTRPLHGRTGSATGLGPDRADWAGPWADRDAPEWVTDPDWITPEELERLREDVDDTAEARDATQDAATGWSHATSAVGDAQRQLGALQRGLVTRWVEGHERFRRSMLEFAESYLRAWQASEPLRARADDWRVHKEAAWAIDMAFGLIQLTRGVFTIGRGLKGWVQGRQATRLAQMGNEAAAAARVSAKEALETSPVLREFAEGLGIGSRGGVHILRDELVDMIVRGRAAGVDVVRIMEDEVVRLGEYARDFGKLTDMTIVNRLHDQVVTASARALGLVEAAPSVANTVDDALGAAHVVAGDVRRLSPEMLGSMQDFVRLVDETPGFWDDASNMYVRLSSAGEVAGLVSPDRLQVLRAVYLAVKQAGDEPLRIPILLAETLGPAKVTAMRAVADGAARAGGQPRAAWNVGTGAADVADTVGASASGVTAVGAVGDVSGHMSQYGITADSYGENLWDLVTSPVETTGGMWHSWFALDELEALFETADGDLTTMGGSFDTTVHAVEQLVDIARSGAVDDVATALADLEASRQALVDAHADAPPDWQADHRSRFEDQLAQIDQQRAAMTNLLTALQQLATIGDGIIGDLRAVEHLSDGTRRGPLEYIDPDVVATLAQVAYALEGLGHEVTGGGAAGDQPPPSWEAQWEELDARSEERADELDAALLDEDDSPLAPDLDLDADAAASGSVMDYLDEDVVDDGVIGVLQGPAAVRQRQWQRGLVAAAAAGVLALGAYVAFGGSDDPVVDDAAAGDAAESEPDAPAGDSQEPTGEPSVETAAAFPAPDDLEAWAQALELEAFRQRLLSPAPAGSDVGPGVRTLEDAIGDVVAESDADATQEENAAGAAGVEQVTLVADAAVSDLPEVDIVAVGVFGPVATSDVVEQLACGPGSDVVRGVCGRDVIADGDHAMTVLQLAAPFASGDAHFYQYTIGWQSTPETDDDLPDNGSELAGMDRWFTITVNPDRELIPVEVAGLPFVPEVDTSLRAVVAGELLLLFHPPTPYDGALRAFAAAFGPDGPPAIGVDLAPDEGFHDPAGPPP